MRLLRRRPVLDRTYCGRAVRIHPWVDGETGEIQGWGSTGRASEQIAGSFRLVEVEWPSHLTILGDGEKPAERYWCPVNPDAVEKIV